MFLKRLIPPLAGAAAVAVLLAIGAFAGVDATYSTCNFQKQGGAEWDVGNGSSCTGNLYVNAGGTLDTSAGALNMAPDQVQGPWLGAGAVTGPKLNLAALKTYAAAGSNGAGPVTTSGTSVGDRVVMIFGAPTAGGALSVYAPGTAFEAAVSVAGQIQQLSATNLSASTLVFVTIPAAS